MTDGHGIHQVALGVHDLERAVAFYRDVVGLPLLHRFDPPGLAFFDLGGPRLLLEHGAPSSLVYLRVAEVEAEIERLRALGVTIEGEPHVIFEDRDGWFGDAHEAEVMAFIRDSEGNLVGIAARRPLA
jgi:methylmalonyl-CoA/ethylmalonyl-CoA epimerase